MNILLDEYIDRRFARELAGHSVTTVPRKGWSGVKNGELLRLAEKEFDVFITVDRKLAEQQLLPGFQIAVILLRAGSNRLELLDRLLYFEQELCAIVPPRAQIKSGHSFALNGAEAVIPDIPEIDYWFSPIQKAVLASLITCRDSFENQRKRDIINVAISSAIVRKWPNTISCAMDIDHSRPHRTRPKPRTIDKTFALFRRIFGEVIVGLRACQTTAQEGSVIHGSCADELRQIPDGSVGLILTSPPYVNAIDYPRAHKFSEWWLSPGTIHCRSINYIGLRSSGVKRKPKYAAGESESGMPVSLDWLQEHAPGKHRLFRTYISDMTKVIVQCRRVLRADGQLVFVLADNRINNRTIPVTSLIGDLLRANGFAQVTTTTREIQSIKRRYPFGFPDRMASEAVIRASN